MSWSNRDVRRILSLVRRPAKLEADPLGLALRYATGADTNLAAIKNIIDRALSGNSEVEKLARDCVTRCDFSGEKTHVAARQFGLSARQFFRYRATAIAAIASEVNSVLQSHQQPADYRVQFAEMLAQFDPQAARSMYLQSADKSNGQAAYELLCLTLRSGLTVTDELLSRCDGQWRLMALAAIGRRHITVGEPLAAELWRTKARAELSKSRRPENVSAAFELTNMDRLEAIRRCDMAAARQAARRMSWLGRDDPALRGISLVVELEQACDDGKIELARSILSELKAHNSAAPDFRTMARSEHARSVLAFVQGDFEEAHAQALTAKAALTEREPGFALCADAYAGRSAVQLGRVWEPGSTLCDRFPNVWITGHVLAIHGRHLLSCDLPRAAERVDLAVQIATTQEAAGALAFANASLALIADRLGDHQRAQTLRVGAWESAVALGRQTLVIGMFSHPWMIERELGSFALDAQFKAAILRRVATRLRKLAEGATSKLATLVEKLAMRALQQISPPFDSGLSQPLMTAADYGPLLASEDSGRDHTDAVRAVTKGLAKDLAMCAAIDQRDRVLAAFGSILDDLRSTGLGESRRVYGAAS